MSRSINIGIFIKLSSQVINTSHIVKITKTPQSYYIYMSTFEITGITLFGSGGIDTSRIVLNVCKDKDEDDYNTITKFIENIPTL